MRCLWLLLTCTSAVQVSYSQRTAASFPAPARSVNQFTTTPFATSTSTSSQLKSTTTPSSQTIWPNDVFSPSQLGLQYNNPSATAQWSSSFASSTFDDDDDDDDDDAPSTRSYSNTMTWPSSSVGLPASSGLLTSSQTSFAGSFGLSSGTTFPVEGQNFGSSTSAQWGSASSRMGNSLTAPSFVPQTSSFFPSTTQASSFFPSITMTYPSTQTSNFFPSTTSITSTTITNPPTQTFKFSPSSSSSSSSSTTTKIPSTQFSSFFPASTADISSSASSSPIASSPFPPLQDRLNHFDILGYSKGPQNTEPGATLKPINYVPVQPAQNFPINPRPIAEWEPVQAAIIRYPLGVSYEVIRAVARELPVYIITKPHDVPQATEYFREAGINISNIVFIDIPTDTPWIRDYGAWFIRTNEGNKRITRIVNTRYLHQETRPNDDRLPQLLATKLNQSTYYDLPLVVQGGNFMSDGAGSAASTTRVSEDNPDVSWDEIKDAMGNILGVKDYLLTPDPGYPTNYIQHVDCWCKFISPEKILVKRLPPSHALYSKYEQAAAMWAARKNLLGQKYQVFRVDGPMESAYVNQVILNDRVFVPVQNIPEDFLALSQIQDAYGPTYRIFPAVAIPALPWLMSDALHCRMNTIPVLDQ